MVPVERALVFEEIKTRIISRASVADIQRQCRYLAGCVPVVALQVNSTIVIPAPVPRFGVIRRVNKASIVVTRNKLLPISIGENIPIKTLRDQRGVLMKLPDSRIGKLVDD